ncbi:hypothetical protein ABPG75_011923 [Micractinium tetrahymenae]
MTSFFVVPSFAPPTLEQLTSEPDEVSLIVSQETKIHQELADIRDYNRGTEPLGVIAAQEELESEQGLSDEELTEEEETDEDEDDELDDEGSDIDADLDGDVGGM